MFKYVTFVLIRKQIIVSNSTNTINIVHCVS